MVAEAAFAGAATPTTTAPASSAKAAILTVFMVVLLSPLRKGCGGWGNPVAGIPHLGGWWLGGLAGELRAVELGGGGHEVARLPGRQVRPGDEHDRDGRLALAGG